MHGPGIKTPASIGRFVCFSRPFHSLFPPVIGLARIPRVSRGPFLQAAFIAFIY